MTMDSVYALLIGFIFGYIFGMIIEIICGN